MPMRIARIYYNGKLNPGDSITLAADAAHYLANVLRLKAGNELILFNGEAGDVKGTITTISKKAVAVNLESIESDPLPSKLHIHLGLGLSKGDRMDYAIQKSVELGVNEITPLSTEFSEVRIKEASRQENKLRHWQRVSVSACEQCGAHAPAHIHEPASFNNFARSESTATRLILDASGEHQLTDIDETEEIILLVGPEGGFSDKEIELAKAQGFISVGLGPRILRTETAPVAAIAILQSRFGDW